MSSLYSNVSPWGCDTTKKSDKILVNEETAKKIIQMIDKGSLGKKIYDLQIERSNGAIETHPVDFSQRGKMLFSVNHIDSSIIMQHSTFRVNIGEFHHKFVQLESLVELNPEWVESLNL